jgi:MYXO-CTERM domain-containing protein
MRLVVQALVLSFAMFATASAAAGPRWGWSPKPAPRPAPELNVAGAGTAFMLLAGGALILAGRRRRQG